MPNSKTFTLQLDNRAAAALITALHAHKIKLVDDRKAHPFDLDLLDSLYAVFHAEDLIRRSMGGEHDGPEMLEAAIQRVDAAGLDWSRTTPQAHSITVNVKTEL